jgi:hypothetical protein
MPGCTVYSSKFRAFSRIADHTKAALTVGQRVPVQKKKLRMFDEFLYDLGIGFFEVHNG